MVNSEELTLYRRCRLHPCRYNRVLLYFFLLPGIVPQSFGCPVHTLITTPTKLSQFHSFKNHFIIFYLLVKIMNIFLIWSYLTSFYAVSFPSLHAA